MANRVNRITFSKSTKTMSHLDRPANGAKRYDKVNFSPYSTNTNDRFDPDNRDGATNLRPDYLEENNA